MSRILKALRRIEVKQRKDAPVRLDAKGGGQKAADSGRKAEGGGQKAADGGQKAESSGQRTAGKGLKAEGGGQKTEGRGQKAEGRGQRTESPPPSTASRPLPTALCRLPSASSSLPADDVESDPRFSPLSEHLLKQFPPDRHAVLMLTSPGPEDGQTRVAAGLVEALAARVPGEVLAVDGATQTSEVAKTSARPEAALEDLRCHYRFVVIDGPCLAHPGATTMASRCDGVLLVIELGHTGCRAARQAVDILEHGGANVLGCVVAGA